MTPDLTREEMIERLIEDTYDGMDYESLYQFVEFYQQRQYQKWSDEQIETEYNERFEEWKTETQPSLTTRML